MRMIAQQPLILVVDRLHRLSHCRQTRCSCMAEHLDGRALPAIQGDHLTSELVSRYARSELSKGGIFGGGL